jgi:hypothetical protein
LKLYFFYYIDNEIENLNKKLSLVNINNPPTTNLSTNDIENIDRKRWLKIEILIINIGSGLLRKIWKKYWNDWKVWSDNATFGNIEILQLFANPE